MTGRLLSQSAAQLKHRMNPKEIIIFQHLSKTAGSTLAKILIRNLPAHEQLAVAPDSRISALGTWSTATVKDALKKLVPGQVEKIRFVGGHLGYGVHTILPKPARYISILRNPVDRVLSGFFYSINAHIKATGEHVSLEEYVFRKRHYDLGLNNHQTRVISGIDDLDPSGNITTGNSRPLTDSDYLIAAYNLKNHYLLAGITEHFDEFLLVLAKKLQWSPNDIIYTKRENVSTNRPMTADIPRHIVEEIEKHNTYDIQLHRLAKDLFKKEIEKYGSSFSKDLENFHAANRQSPLENPAFNSSIK